MGNCCDSIDFKIIELLEFNDFSACEKKFNYSHEHSYSESELLSNDSTREEISQTFLKFRNRKNKLKTIIEDNHEENLNSPFLLKRRQYHLRDIGDKINNFDM